MAHLPQHPDNPYNPSLPEAERIPAKLWELLRRNEKFQRAVTKLQGLDEIAKLEGAREMEGKRTPIKNQFQHKRGY